MEKESNFSEAPEWVRWGLAPLWLCLSWAGFLLSAALCLAGSHCWVNSCCMHVWRRASSAPLEWVEGRMQNTERCIEWLGRTGQHFWADSGLAGKMTRNHGILAGASPGIMSWGGGCSRTWWRFTGCSGCRGHGSVTVCSGCSLGDRRGYRTALCPWPAPCLALSCDLASYTSSQSSPVPLAQVWSSPNLRALHPLPLSFLSPFLPSFSRLSFFFFLFSPFF